jgi:ribosomal protein S18 acetylase RimI-like enzyme
VPYRKATVRPCKRGEESLLFSLARAAFGAGERWSDQEALTALARDTVFVAELEGEAAGYVAVEREGDALRVAQLLVSPLHEHEGIGRQLLDYVEGYAISLGLAKLQVVVEEDNLRARDFYRRRGFVAAGDDLLELALPRR